MTSRSRTGLLVSVLFGLLATNITFTIFNVALVDIAGTLHTTSSTLTWAITGPLLMVGVSAPILGRWGDIHGHRRLYLAGVVGSLLCALLTALAWNAGALITARLFSGLGGACLTASSWALLFRAFGPAERTRVLGWWSLVGAGGPVIGVAIGGPVVQTLGWRWIFVGQIPLIIAALVANWRILPETEPPAGAPQASGAPAAALAAGAGAASPGAAAVRPPSPWRRVHPRRRSPGPALDVPGAVLLAVGVGAVLLAINRAGQGITRPLVVVSLVVAAVCLPAFALYERRAPSPVFPIEWLSDRAFVLPCIAAFATNFAYMGGFFLTPLFLEQGLHYSVGAAGFFQIARPLVFAIAAPAAGYLALRTGERATAVAGAVILLCSMLAFAVIAPGSPALVIILALAASGLANGLAIPCISALFASSVEVERMGSASAGMQVASQVGVVAGIQVMETVQVARQHLGGVVGSYHWAYLVGGLVTLLSAGAALAIRPRPGGSRPGPAITLADRGVGPEAALEVG